MLILKTLRCELDPRGGVQAVASEVRTVRGCVAANTQENSTKIHHFSITFCISFERDVKALKRRELVNWDRAPGNKSREMEAAGKPKRRIAHSFTKQTRKGRPPKIVSLLLTVCHPPARSVLTDRGSATRQYEIFQASQQGAARLPTHLQHPLLDESAIAIHVLGPALQGQR